MNTLPTTPFLRWVVDHQSKQHANLCSLQYALTKRPEEVAIWIEKRLDHWITQATEEGVSIHECDPYRNRITEIIAALQKAFPQL